MSWSQAQVAEHADTTTATISRLESGQRPATRSMAQRIGEALGDAPGALLAAGFAAEAAPTRPGASPRNPIPVSMEPDSPFPPLALGDWIALEYPEGWTTREDDGTVIPEPPFICQLPDNVPETEIPEIIEDLRDVARKMTRRVRRAMRGKR